MIKFVYFDVGGVVIKDFSGTNKWKEMTRDMGITSEQDKKFDEFFDKYSGEVCVGQNVETLISLMEKGFGLKFSENYSFLRDFVDRFEKNKSIWPVIEKAKNKYKIGLLTNMYPGMLDLIKQKGIMSDVEWDVIIDSSVEGVLKPQREIYELAEKKVGVHASEILFVENSRGHVGAAKKLGWQTFLYDSSNVEKASQKLERILDSMKVL